MVDFNKDAKDLLEYIGGPDNISAVSHCATRMRFVLNDPAAANIKKIEDIPAVKGTFTQAGQFQVIIGNEVPQFYNEFAKVSGKEGVSKDEAKAAAKQNQNVVQRAMAVLAEIFTPLIPAIVVGGLILGFRNVLEGINFANGTIVSNSQFWTGVNDFLWLIGEAIFHFLPVGITWSITKKMGTTQILGIVLGITLVSPQLLNAYGVAGAQEIPFWDFGAFTINKIGYQAQVIPAMLAGFVLAYLEIWLRKWVPQYISMIVRSSVGLGSYCHHRAYSVGAYRLDDRTMGFRSRLCRIDRGLQMAVRSVLRYALFAARHHGASPYVQCHRPAADRRFRRHEPVADDRSFEYRTRLGSNGDHLPAQRE